MKYYKDSRIPVYNFFKYIETKDHKLLLKKKCKNITQEQIQFLDEAFTSIFYEYCYLTKDDTLLYVFKREIFLEFTETKINTITKILDLYREFGEIEVLDLLNDIDIPFTRSKDIDNQVKVVIRKLKGLRNKYKIARSKIKDVKTQSSFNLEKETSSIEISLGLKYSIDTQTCTLNKWVSKVILIKEKNNHG